MKVLRDYQGTPIRLTDERLAHILEHPEMKGMEQAEGAFVLTAYLTDQVKKGTQIWPTSA